MADFNIEVKLNLKGLLLKDFSKTMRIFSEEFGKLFEEGTAFLMKGVLRGTPVWRGVLANSVFREVKGTALNLHGTVATPLNYSGFIETGQPAHTPNFGNLAEWVRAKMGLSGSDLYAVTKVISRKIAVSGIKPNFMFKKAFETGKLELPKMVRKTEKRIINRWEKG